MIDTRRGAQGDTRALTTLVQAALNNTRAPP
jgi:hypothetical protein